MFEDRLSLSLTRAIVADGFLGHVRARLAAAGFEHVDVTCMENAGWFGDSFEFRFETQGARLPVLLTIERDGGTVVTTPIGETVPRDGRYYGVENLRYLMDDTLVHVAAFIEPSSRTLH